MKMDRGTADCEVAGQAAPLLKSAVRVARVCYSDAEIIEQVNRALAEAAELDAAEAGDWDSSWPTLF